MLAAQPLATGRLDPDHRSLTSSLPGLNAKDDDSTPWSPRRSIVERASGSAPIDEFLLHSSCVFYHQAVPLHGVVDVVHNGVGISHRKFISKPGQTVPSRSCTQLEL